MRPLRWMLFVDLVFLLYNEAILFATIADAHVLPYGNNADK